MRLEKGVTKFSPLFIGDQIEATPYYAYVTHKPTPGWQTAEGMGIPVYDPAYGRRPPQVTNAKTKTRGKKRNARRKVTR